MKQFHDLEFDIPNNYSFVDKDNYLKINIIFISFKYLKKQNNIKG